MTTTISEPKSTVSDRIAATMHYDWWAGNARFLDRCASSEMPPQAWADMTQRGKHWVA